MTRLGQLAGVVEHYDDMRIREVQQHFATCNRKGVVRALHQDKSDAIPFPLVPEHFLEDYPIMVAFDHKQHPVHEQQGN